MPSASRDRVSVMRGVALSRAPPDAVWRAFSEPALVPKWFSGARDVEVSADYPRAGSRLAWRVGRWRFEGEVAACEPPVLLRQVVQTPSARSTVTHRVVATSEGARYEKEVAAEWKGRLGRFLARPIVARSVAREAQRVARLAESLTAGASSAP